MVKHAPAAGRLASDRDIIGVSAKCCNIFIYPFKSRPLIEQSEICGCIRRFLRYLGMKEEYGMALFFSGRGMLLGECALQKGSYVFSNEFCDIILETGSRLGASSFIIAHNHVLSRPIPSVADTMTTGRIEEFFSKRELIFADHFIVAGSDYTTMKTKGYWTKRYDGKTLEIE